MKRVFRGYYAVSYTLIVFVVLSSHAGALEPEGRDYDARIQRNAEIRGEPDPAALDAARVLRSELPELVVRYDPVSGGVRSVLNRGGYLTQPDERALKDLDTFVRRFLDDHRTLLGLTVLDLVAYEVTDQVYSSVSGATHVYLRQTHAGIPVYNGQLQVHLNREGRVSSVNSAFLRDLGGSVRHTIPNRSALDAVLAAAEHLEIPEGELPAVLEASEGSRRSTRLRAPALSQDEIQAELFWLPVGPGEVRLVWNFQVRTLDDRHWYDITVDADTGEVWTRFDWARSSTFNMFQEADESPLHGTMGRQVVIDPENATASPNGWFTGGTMAGNNVHACPDTNGNNACDSDPQCSGTTCDFPLDLSQAPSASIPAATANLFYWNNLVHDIQYVYGFDEAGGNFQENNFGLGGLGSDSVNAEAQDGSGNCNANFATPTDGGNPRMQMFTCTNASPARDGAFDNGMIVHEYGHGISIRQVGGPGNSSCLNNLQQPGEGWSDWLALVYTAELGDAGTDARGIGSYLFALTPEGGTIRDLPYSTNPAINNWTYESINGAAAPHGVGSRWAQALWEVYWALVETWGFEADLANFDVGDPNEAGNKRALFYVNEGLKQTACSPTFVDARDAILQVAVDNFGGVDECLLWETFAAFGLGADAVPGGPNSTSVINGFSLPQSCPGSPDFSISCEPMSLCLHPGDCQNVICTVTSTGGFNSPVTLDCFGEPAGTTCTFSQNPLTPPADGFTQTTLNVCVPDTQPAGEFDFNVEATSGQLTRIKTMTVTVKPEGQNGPQAATYTAALGAPECALPGGSCDSGTLLDGRASLGPEPNQPNTLDACTDGGSGTYHSDESIDRVVVSTLDGLDFVEGATVQVDVTVWPWNNGSADTLDLYYAADASNPVWTYITSIVPPAGGLQTLSAQFTLPSGTQQAVRANFRYQGSVSPCGTSSWDDTDDLVFAVHPKSPEQLAYEDLLTGSYDLAIPAEALDASGTVVLQLPVAGGRDVALELDLETVGAGQYTLDLGSLTPIVAPTSDAMGEEIDVVGLAYRLSRPFDYQDVYCRRDDGTGGSVAWAEASLVEPGGPTHTVSARISNDLFIHANQEVLSECGASVLAEGERTEGERVWCISWFSDDCDDDDCNFQPCGVSLAGLLKLARQIGCPIPAGAAIDVVIDLIAEHAGLSVGGFCSEVFFLGLIPVGCQCVLHTF